MEDHADGDNRRVICVVILFRDGKFVSSDKYGVIGHPRFYPDLFLTSSAGLNVRQTDAH